MKLGVVSWIVIASILWFTIIIGYYSWYDSVNTEDKWVYLGEIKDFEVSSGGFGSPSLCRIVTDEIIVSGKGSGFCGKLESGKPLYRDVFGSLRFREAVSE